MHIIYLLLGGNIGDRIATLQQAQALINVHIGNILKPSELYETAAWGVENQPNFINQVISVETTRSPEEVLKQIHFIEKALGRTRHQKWHARTIDIDILFYNREIINTKDLTIPHPFIQERRFTLVPLQEIAPDFIHPTLNVTITELLEDCNDSLPVFKWLDDLEDGNRIPA